MYDSSHRPQPQKRSGRRPTQALVDSPRRLALHLDRNFLAPNIVCFAVTVTLGTAPGDILAARLFDTDVTLGLSLYLLQAVVLLITAHRFDRRCVRLLDPLQHPLVSEDAAAQPAGHLGGQR
ncbi:hypothetical protein ABTY96_44495 [Streptomyces sp. NPDC096057]|uniref:hypothetical protein n=1 Tax=Streptomyces sp. NPDC096057 TaxID=3155543 RepID=UPI003319D77E